MIHTGLEVLLHERLDLLRGRRVGLVSHAAAVLPDLTLALDAWIVRAMGRVPEGVIGRWSLAYIRVRMKSEILEAAGAQLFVVSP